MEKVKVTNYHKRTTESGREFFTLELSGGVEIAVSKNGNTYATAKKCSIPTTFGEEICQSMIGQDIAGSIERQDCEPFQWSNPDTGETIILNHRYSFLPALDMGSIMKSEKTAEMEFA